MTQSSRPWRRNALVGHGGAMAVILMVPEHIMEAYDMWVDKVVYVTVHK